MNQIKNQWLAVVNVFAASKKAGSVWKHVAVMLDYASVPYSARFTGGADNAMELTRKACSRGYRRFIAVGGDGTIHDVLNGIAVYVSSVSDVSFSDFTLAVIPVGSGNDWVKSTKVPDDISAAVSLIAMERYSKQDVVKVSVLDESEVSAESYMVNIGGVGLDARVCEIVNRKKGQGKRGKQLYVSALLYCIGHRLPVRAKVICDGVDVFDGKYLSIAFGIGKYSGGGMRQTPLALMDDGLLDVTVIPDVSLWTIAMKAPRLFTGTFHKVDILTQARCREVLILPYAQSDAEPVEVDGEVIGRGSVRLTVLPDQLNIVSNL